MRSATSAPSFVESALDTVEMTRSTIRRTWRSSTAGIAAAPSPGASEVGVGVGVSSALADWGAWAKPSETAARIASPAPTRVAAFGERTVLIVRRFGTFGIRRRGPPFVRMRWMAVRSRTRPMTPRTAPPMMSQAEMSRDTGGGVGQTRSKPDGAGSVPSDAITKVRSAGSVSVIRSVSWSWKSSSHRSAPYGFGTLASVPGWAIDSRLQTPGSAGSGVQALPSASRNAISL